MGLSEVGLRHVNKMNHRTGFVQAERRGLAEVIPVLSQIEKRVVVLGKQPTTSWN